MATTFANLRTWVYHRLGDKQYAAGVASAKAPLAAVDEAINEAVEDLFADVADAGYSPRHVRVLVDFGWDYLVQVVTITGSPTGGTFRLSLANAYKDIAYNADPNVGASSVQTLMRAIDPFTTNGLVVTGTAGATYTLTWPLVIGRSNIPKIIADTTLLTGGTAPGITLTQPNYGSIEQEINIDHWLRTAAGAPNYRGTLHVEGQSPYSNGTWIQLPFAGGGQYHRAQMYQGGLYVPSYDPGSSSGQQLYHRERKLGLVDPPSQEHTLRVSYEGLPPQFTVGDADGDETLFSIGAQALEPYKRLLACRAAVLMLSDRNSEQYQLVSNELARRENRFMSQLADLEEPLVQG